MSPRAARRLSLGERIEHYHAASDGTYGARRIRADLCEEGELVSVKTVAKIMRHKGIEGISPASFVPATTLRDPDGHRLPDLVEQHFDQGRLDVVWCSDITYLATGEGWLYLCAVR